MLVSSGRKKSPMEKPLNSNNHPIFSAQPRLHQNAPEIQAYGTVSHILRQITGKNGDIPRTGKKEIVMKVKQSIVLASILALGTVGFTQDVASDVD
jgi:hypothetical protein